MKNDSIYLLQNNKINYEYQIDFEYLEFLKHMDNYICHYEF